MNKQEHSDKHSNWKRIMDLQCSTQKKINITFYGDWGVSVHQRDANKVDRPMYEIMKQKKMEWYWGDEDEDPQFVVQDHGDLQNAKQAFQNIDVDIKITQQQFRNLYGFWQINDFTVYDRDGNHCYFSFRAKDKFYWGSYGTS